MYGPQIQFALGNPDVAEAVGISPPGEVIMKTPKDVMEFGTSLDTGSLL